MMSIYLEKNKEDMYKYLLRTVEKPRLYEMSWDVKERESESERERENARAERKRERERCKQFIKDY